MKGILFFYAYIANSIIIYPFVLMEKMSFPRRRESKAINREGALDILDPCLRRDDIKENRDDILQLLRWFMHSSLIDVNLLYTVHSSNSSNV